MPSTDPIADLLTVLRNASLARLDTTRAVDSRFGRTLLQVLQSEGFIKSFRSVNDKGKKRVEIAMSYGPARERLFNGAKRVSRPGRRVYSNLDDLKPMLRRLETPILSTSMGIMTGSQALAKKLGGELLCLVW